MKQFMIVGGHALEVQPSRALANTGRTEASTWTVGGASVEGSTLRTRLLVSLGPHQWRLPRSTLERTNESNVIFCTALGVKALCVRQAAKG